MNSPLTRDLWYIDAGGKQIGPLHAAKIIASLMMGEYRVTHRVSRDKMAWKALCNQPHFEKLIEEQLLIVVEEAKQLGLSGMTDGQNSGVDSLSADNLGDVQEVISGQLDHAQNMQDIGVEITVLRKLLADIKANKKNVFTEDPPVVDQIHPDDRDEFIPAQRNKIKFRKPAMVLAAVILVAAAYSGYCEFKKEQARAQELEREAQAKIAAKNTLLSNYEIALDRPTHVAGAGITDDSAEGLEASRASALEQINKAKVIVGGSQAKQQVLAAHDSPTALQYVSSHNLAVQLIEKNELEKAEALLLQILSMPFHDKSSSVFSLFEVAYKLDRQEGAQEDAWPRVRKVKTLLDRAYAWQTSLAPQLLAARVVALNALSQEHELKLVLDVFIGQNPVVVAALDDNSGLNLSRTAWSNISSWCGEVLERDRKSDLRNAFYAHCLVRAGWANKAVPYAEYAFRLSPNNADLLALHANILYSDGQIPAAAKVLADHYKSPQSASKLFKLTSRSLCHQNAQYEFCEPSVVTNKTKKATRLPSSKISSPSKKKSARRR